MPLTFCLKYSQYPHILNANFHTDMFQYILSMFKKLLSTCASNANESKAKTYFYNQEFYNFVLIMVISDVTTQ